jgi:glycosyltransferase involved in cell wall biosynthesis
MIQPEQAIGHPPTKRADWPSVSIAICTRNRHASLRRAVAAVVAADPDVEELLIIDQSDEFVPLARPWARGFRHVHSESRGLSRACNEALELATTEIVFFTDDDCLLQPGSVEAAVAMFAKQPEVGVVFGAVRAEPSVTAEGFIPTYEPPRRQVLRGRLGKLRDGGIGACLAVRRQAALAIGGFDVRLGGGTPLTTCQDGEFAYRMLKGGFALGHEPAAWVLHEGVKPWREGSRYAYLTYRGVGAAYALHLRQLDSVALLLLGQQFWSVIIEIGRNVLRGRHKYIGLRRIIGLVAGVKTGLTMREPLAERSLWAERSP